MDLILTETAGIPRHDWPLTRGIPFSPGELHAVNLLRLIDEDNDPVAAQFRILSRWPDSSIKWILADFQADVAAYGERNWSVHCDGNGPVTAPTSLLKLAEDDERITVDTGILRFSVSHRQFSLLEDVHIDGTSAGSGGDAWVRICEAFGAGVGQRRVYGMGGQCRASLGQQTYRASIEESGPLRAVVRLEGDYEADIPMHHYTGYRPFRYVVRIYAYAGKPFLRVLHTVVVACNPQQTEVEEISVRVPATLSGELRYGVSSSRPTFGLLPPHGQIHLAHVLDNHFKLYCREERNRLVAEGEHCDGWMTVEDAHVGVGVALRYMAEEYPKALEISGTGQGIDIHLWRHPDGKRLNFRRYAEEVAWHEGEGIYSDGIGTAKTSEYFIHYYPPNAGDHTTDLLRGLLAQPHVAVDPIRHSRCQVTGGFAAVDTDRFPATERMLSGFVEWLIRSVRLGRWYSFFDWGDFLVAWDEAKNDWRFTGRWGWCNSEWDPRHGIWIQYLRSGTPGLYDLAEAMTRHSMDVDTCHYHPFRPYMVGGCFRHSVDHYGDETCASHTFIDNWMDYYYLTGDLRTKEVLQEAGNFFLSYRWSEDPAFSFSLRSIANTLRGLLYLYEATGEERYMKRAEQVFSTIARGQNEDGSWHKRFQISTPDRLPNQAPYGMASEGTTLAVEMGSAPPFTDEEHIELGGTDGPQHYVLPYDQQKGYQTHYLLIGIELLHRLTGREDVAKVFLRATDWFCGHPGPLNAETAFGYHYGGIICRHLAYCYRLTNQRRYLEIGRAVLMRLMDLQNWSADPKRRGAVLMSPMYLSLLFFGAPFLIEALGEADMEERTSD